MELHGELEDGRGSIVIASSLLRNVLIGTSEHIQPIGDQVQSIERWIDGNAGIRTWLEWTSSASQSFTANKSCFDLASFCVGLAALEQTTRTFQQAKTTTLLESIWHATRDVLKSSEFTKKLHREASDAEAGFMIPLCFMGQEMGSPFEIRLHIRLSDGSSYDSVVQPHAFDTANWILCGEADHHAVEQQGYRGLPEPDSLGSYSGAGGISDGDRKKSAPYTRDMLIWNAKGTRTRTHVAADTTYAIVELVRLDTSASESTSSSSSSINYVPVPPSRQVDSEAAALARIVDSVREWETEMTTADLDAQEGRWEHALRACNDALYICDTELTLASLNHYRYVTVDYLCFVNRSLGRYELALAAAEGTVTEMQPGLLRAGMYAEIAAVYRLMGRLEEAKSTFQKEYADAKAYDLPQHMCKAIGNLGMINYQLYLRDKQDIHLALAISQLKERVERARSLQTGNGDYANTLEIIGLSRLSLCYAQTADTSNGLLVARIAQQKASNIRDPSVKAMARLFYGRALSRDGQSQAAMAEFTNAEGLTPAMALCKEPSDENFGFLRELADLDVPLDVRDDQGYSALHYAIFNSHEATKTLVYNALCSQIGIQLADDMHSDALLQKGYREIFQDEMRPTLLRRDSHGLRETRQLYAGVLASDPDKRNAFDSLKFVRYSDLASFGRFPRSSDGLTREFTTDSTEQTVRYLIFLSYRWINRDPWTLRSTPDDAENSQYRRTIAAIDEFLSLNPSINIETLGIWVDFACIDQESPRRGIVALPMIIAQCNALVSLVDDEYHTRAWCSVEVMMIQRLRAAYGLHHWYEHVARGEGELATKGESAWSLREGPGEFCPDLAKKRLRFEEDRPRVMFLERQSKLLC